MIGMGPINIGYNRILVSIKNKTLTYPYEKQLSIFQIHKIGNNIDTEWNYKTLHRDVYFRPSSADSIIDIIKNIKEKNIGDVALAIDGAELEITIKYGMKGKLKIELFNTFDSLAYKIATIINPYLPDDCKLDIPYDDLEENTKLHRYEDSLGKLYH